MTEVNKERVLLLVEYLENENPPQIVRQLKKVDPETGKVVGTCCLGDGCDVAIRNGLEVEVTYGQANKSIVYYDEEPHTLPRGVREWYGFDDYNPFVAVTDDLGNEVQMTLAELNDGNGIRQHTKHEIAQVLRKNFLDG